MSTLIFIVFSLILGISVSLNVYLLLKKPKIADRKQSIELREFLADLLSGPAILGVARLDPNDVMLRSPKQK
jgi:hypothetical protein